MAQRTDIKESAALSYGPEDSSQSVESSNQPSDTGADGFKTIHILKEWPIILSTVNKSHDIYESMKRSSKILNWSCNLAERFVGALSERYSAVVPVIYPAMRIADLAGSQLAEELQHKMPVVREQPSQVYDAVRSGLSNLVAPITGTIEFTVAKGKKRTRNAAKSVIQMYRILVLYLDKWMQEIEKYMNTSKSKGIQAPQAAEQACASAPVQRLRGRSLGTRAVSAATSAVLFGVGASVWLVSKLPLVGALLDLTPASSPASSKSTSPVRQAELRASHSSSESTTAADVAETVEQERGSMSLPENQDSKQAQSEKLIVR